MTTAEIITIGTELLLGEIVDTNSVYLARALRNINVDLFRTTTVGDNPQRIASLISEALSRSQIILTTGGLGPTVDDPTREAVALAFGVKSEFRPEVWENIAKRLLKYGRTPTENQKRQAFLPEGAKVIDNPVGTAPAFIMEKEGKTAISLPGVPKEMEYLLEKNVLPYLQKHYALHGIIKTRILHTAGVAEAVIDELIGELELRSNPTVGLAARAGQVDVRITAKAQSLAEADEMLATVENELLTRLGIMVYGADEDTLGVSVLRAVEKQNWKLSAIECGLEGLLLSELSKPSLTTFAGGQTIPSLTEDNLEELLLQESLSRQTQAALGIFLQIEETQSQASICAITPHTTRLIKRVYGGHPRYAPSWAANTGLELLRRMVIENAA